MLCGPRIKLPQSQHLGQGGNRLQNKSDMNGRQDPDKQSFNQRYGVCSHQQLSIFIEAVELSHNAVADRKLSLLYYFKEPFPLLDELRYRPEDLKHKTSKLRYTVKWKRDIFGERG